MPFAKWQIGFNMVIHVYDKQYISIVFKSNSSKSVGSVTVLLGTTWITVRAWSSIEMSIRHYIFTVYNNLTILT